MSRPTNPLAQIVTKTSQAVASATSAASSAASNLSAGLTAAGSAAAASIDKAELDKKISQAAGDIGSALNGATGGDIGRSLSLAGQQVSTALGSLGNVAGSLSNIAAGAADTLGKLTGGAATAGGLGSGLLSAARNVAAAAGQINNLLSVFRGKNIPKGADLFSQTGAQVKVVATQASDWRVRLSCDFSGVFGAGAFPRLTATNGLIWPYLPNITIVSKANYTQAEPVHNNFPYQSYKNSQIEDINISGEFSCETEADAEYWIAATTFLRTATKMFYGTGPNAGNPPVICKLTGYGTSVFNSVPVIIKSFQIDLKDDVNYVRCVVNDQPTWVPILSTISVTVAPIYNRERLRRFSLEKFARGQEVGMI
jgi:hypothetical protein